MLLRSSSTPFLRSFLSSSSPSSPSSLQLRRAFSDSHLPSLNPSSSDSSNKTTGLHTELSFSIYNTFNKAPPAQPHHQEQEQEQNHQQTVQPELPELPLFLARGLGIDRIASGLFTAGAAKSKAATAKMDGVEERLWDEVVALDEQYKKMLDEQPGNALFLRNYAQFLHEVVGLISRLTASEFQGGTPHSRPDRGRNQTCWFRSRSPALDKSTGTRQALADLWFLATLLPTDPIF